ncbi:conserved membrane hypothetical protein [uncultured Paludibacter sp.]|uniref:DUF5362 domain-containing protein n=1 Tax=uncultured Paludibacter sp. TaxID=497635 RepID=A0A653AEF8_9BACT|nr:conserved membrane hypothetical protein [uncultured Paludibacter sp.]
MENNITITSENQSIPPIEKETHNLVITPESESYLTTTAKWSQFLAILGFILVGLVILLGFTFSLFSSVFNEFSEADKFPVPGFLSFVWIIYIAMGALYFFPTYYLFLFSKKVQEAIQTKNQAQLDEGFRNMKRLAKFVGITTLVVICLYVIAIPLAFIGTIFGASFA